MDPNQAANQQNNSTGNVLFKATFFSRLLAFLIDNLVTLPLLVIISLIFNAFGGLQFNLLAQLLAVFFIWFYYVYLTWKSGATLGKHIMKIQVVNLTYQPISFKQALLRETIGRVLSHSLADLGYIWVIWDKNHQSWHDKIVKTYVVTRMPNNGHESKWWLLLVIPLLLLPVITTIAAIFIMSYISLQSTNKILLARDEQRLSDVGILQGGVSKAIANGLILCNNNLLFCEGKSTDTGANRRSDGTGWLMVDLSSSIPSFLPVDPINKGNYFYHYCSNATQWEINLRLESKVHKPLSAKDGGNDVSLYEVGTDLHLCDGLPQTQ